MSKIAFGNNIEFSEPSSIWDNIDDAKVSFHEKYTILDKIGKGTYSTVFLCKNSQNKLVIAKQYALTDPDLIKIFEDNGISVDAYIKNLAQKELEIGRLTEHPHVVKVHEVFLEHSTAYIILDYIRGKSLDSFSHYSTEMRIALAQQFLSAIEHLLLRNIIVDDLWSENILISNDSHLTLIDLGGNEIIGQDAHMPIKHYFQQIKFMLKEIGGETVKAAIDQCKDLLPATLTKKIISPADVKIIIKWIEALQNQLSVSCNLSNTFHENTSDSILYTYDQLQTQYPEHFSFSTAQHSNLLVYSLITTSILKKFKPGKYTKSYLENVHFLRYPFPELPKNLKELFELFPVRKDYDTHSNLVGSALISANPSLKETESEESAWAIFNNNERKTNVLSHISNIFEFEQVSQDHFFHKIQQLIKKAPKSDKGLIYNFFIPINAPLHKAIYLSKPYGIPRGNPIAKNKLLNFYNKYKQGLREGKNDQLRFLPSAITVENNFDLNQIKSYRFTTISQVELENYAQKVERVVKQIFEAHLEEMIKLAVLAADVEALKCVTKKQNGYRKLCYKHLCRRDSKLMLYYWHKIDNQDPYKVLSLTSIITCLLKKGLLTEAYHYFQKCEEQLVYREQLIVRFALNYIERGNRSMLDLMLSKLSDPKLKNFVLFIAHSHYPEYDQGYISKDLILMSDEELINLAAISD